jgi:hypothetical protein
VFGSRDIFANQHGKRVLTVSTATAAPSNLIVIACCLQLDEAFLLEDLCADIIELEAETGQLTVEMARANPTILKASKLIALSQRILNDAALARQIRRKYLVSDDPSA